MTASLSRIPAFARFPVFLIAGVTGVLLLLASRNYGYSFDEAYFIIAGRDHPAWGYFDQPPLLPVLAALLDGLAPGSLVVLRLPATLAAVGGILVTALIARELGGRRVAQGVAAGAAALSAMTVLSHYLATSSLDPFFWTLIVWLLVRWTRLHGEGADDDRLLLFAGLVTAVSLQTKFLVPALWVAVAIGALAFGPRRLLGRPWLWGGWLIATAATVPTLLWQNANGWPYQRMTDVVAREFPGTGQFLWQALTGAGLVIGVPLAVFGLGRLLIARSLQPYRYLGVAFVLLVVAFLVMSGRSYYVFGVYALPFAAGAVGLQDREWHVSAKIVGAVLLVPSVLLTLVALPLYPKSWAERIPDSSLFPLTAKVFAHADGMLRELSDAVVTVYWSLPAEKREHLTVMTDSYAFAADIQFVGSQQAFPIVYSPHRGYYYFGRPGDESTDVLFVGDPSPELVEAFERREELVPGLMTVFSGRKKSWETLWPILRTQ
ncbi:ArnT family glycosyltransferase [Actinokineospora enzanensis]|uniref:ArnT family glycosyltransferase n=1 Tax=Actinokineospora enzanensis TaxID=155975 RepID=UPI00037DAA7C|nr:glycosyltransferase family 39 protein [Actinokineospora enzanensis]